MKTINKLFILIIIALIGVCPVCGQRNTHGRVVVHPGNHFLMYEDGTPFFWLGDTAWQMFHRHTPESARTYIADRAMKGFNVLQSVCLAEHGGLSSPNAVGEWAFVDEDCTVPNDKFFDNIERIVDIADSMGVMIGFLPTWGDKINLKWGPGPVIFDTEEKAENYGKYMGRRFGKKDNIIWILGGDRPADGYEDIFRALARGIAIGATGSEDYSKLLMTYHPWGGTSCTKWFTDEPWLDFYMQQNGHPYDVPLWDRILADYNDVKPTRPVLDGEPLYDEHAIDFDMEKNGVSTDYHTRRYFYHEVFSGACGHTFGSTGVWQVYDPDKYKPAGNVFTRWEESLGRIASYQMGYGKELMLSRPYFTRIPDQSILHEQYDHLDRITATRDSDGTYAFIYTERGKPIDVDLTAIGSGDEVTAWWYDVRSGRPLPLGNFKREKSAVFTPPTKGTGNDWVLVIDDPACGYPAPGSHYEQK